MTKKTVHVKKVDVELWRRFKAVATLRGLEMGVALEEAIKKWMEETK